MKERTKERTKVKRYEYRNVKTGILKNSGLPEYWNTGTFQCRNIGMLEYPAAGMMVKTGEQLQRQIKNQTNSQWLKQPDV
jgi:hypothetical protein